MHVIVIFQVVGIYNLLGFAADGSPVYCQYYKKRSAMNSSGTMLEKLYLFKNDWALDSGRNGWYVAKTNSTDPATFRKDCAHS